ncbi:lysophospholipase [Mycena olivaceomarginata]|nr:lysophospholipase [Mycena olivaceomarginata]
MPLHSEDDMVSDAYTETWLVGPQSTNFYTRTYFATEPKAVLVFIHGFAEHVGRYTEAHPQFAARGISVFTFDQRGFGKTALDAENKSPSSAYGKTSGEHQMDDIHWGDRAREEGVPWPAGVFERALDGRRRVIACSPLVQQTDPSSQLRRALGALAAVFFPYFPPIPAPLNFNDLSHDAKYNEMCRNDSLSKLQGTLRGLTDMLNWGDELLRVNHTKWPKTLPITSHSAAKDFHDKIVSDDKNMIIYPDGFHELVQEPAHTEKLLNDEIAWIEAHLSKAAEFE